MGRYDKINSSRSKNRKEKIKNKNSIYIIKFLTVGKLKQKLTINEMPFNQKQIYTFIYKDPYCIWTADLYTLYYTYSK